MPMRHLILMGGIPGSGKSTYSAKLIEGKKNGFILNADDVRKEFTGSYAIMTEPTSLVWDEVIRRANEYLAKHDECTLIIDSTFLTDERRKYYLERLENYDKLTHILIKFHDYSICYERNKLRDREKWVPEPVMDAMLESYKDPSPEIAKRFDEIKVVYKDE